MPGVNLPPQQQLGAMIAKLDARQRASATQQQFTFSNGIGQPILNLGLIPGSNPAQYGLQFIDPNSGNPRMFIGTDASGAAVIEFYDSNGAATVQLGANGLGVYNGTTLEVLLGLLNSSPAIYGLGVLPFGGSALQQVGGSLSTGSLTVTTSNVAGTWNTFSGSSTITAEIGPSGNALLSGSFQVETVGSLSGGGSDAVVSCRLLIDGATSEPLMLIGIPFTTGSPLVSYTGGSTVQVSGLSAGSHTFACQWNVAAAGQTQSTQITGSASVQPL